ncbi:hypothetical protein ACRAWD_25675 [Caulobacter segnis]
MRIFLLAAVSALASSPAGAAISGAALAADKPMYGAWGVDLTAGDKAVKPGDDFNKYANGAWEKKTTIPADQAPAGVGYDVYNRSQDQLRTWSRRPTPRRRSAASTRASSTKPRSSRSTTRR